MHRMYVISSARRGNRNPVSGGVERPTRVEQKKKPRFHQTNFPNPSRIPTETPMSCQRKCETFISAIIMLCSPGKQGGCRHSSFSLPFWSANSNSSMMVRASACRVRSCHPSRCTAAQECVAFLYEN